MEVKPLSQQIAEMRQSFFDEGLLDDHYIQLEELAGELNPNFVVEVITLYFRDSPNHIATLENALEKEPPEFPKITKCLHQLKGSSGSIGAIKVWAEVDKAKTLVQQGNIEGAKAAVQDVKRGHSALRAKFEPYFQMMRQAGPTEQAVNSS